MIYADNAATTKLSPVALAAMTPYFTEDYGNPSSLYNLATHSKAALDRARADVALCLNAQPEEIFFTSGGTESDNWALRGVAEALNKKGKHILISAVEHHAILHTAQWMRKQGFDVEELSVDEFGTVQPEVLKDALRPDTILVSIMMANNEIGTIEPVKELAAIAHENGTLFHTDAVQAAGHIPVDVNDLGVDLLSLSGHKFHGPRGVGVLYIKSRTPILPLIHGGGQERNRRSGTENVAGAVGLAAALKERCAVLEEEIPRISTLRDKLIQEVLKFPRTRLTGDPVNRLPSIASFTFEAIEGESILLKLDARGICVSSGSACSSASLEPSHVLLAIGLPHEIAHGSVRISLGSDVTEDDVDTIILALKEVVNHLRAMSPVWDTTAQKATW
ncbi:cysteine desulfurase NifS [Muriventricola aceti]|uniref:cysteine desulfurase NifS n=1 Tax=Muriventricola aceti TaxID=2981773 RepID=UPI001DCB7D0B|nr:cysteine desulfurase NifS [Clostridiales bacterium]